MSEEGLEYDRIVQDGPKKADMVTNTDDKSIRQAYEDVRSDSCDTEWAVFKHENSIVVCAAVGSNFDEFKDQFGDDDRAFGYIRIQMGDEISKRTKFLFLTWVGKNVGVIKKAKMSTDKALIKAVISNFAVELHLESINEIDMNYFKEQLAKAGGANYGTGIRED